MYFPTSLLDDRGPLSSASDKLGKPLLYIVRHANVAEDSEGKIRGLLNPGLDAKGKRGAKDVADFFKDIPLSAIYADDLKRTIQTALPLAAEKELELQIDPELRSWDIGTEMEGELISKHEDAIAEYRQQPHKVPVAGQSWGDYKEQVEDFMRRYISRALDFPNPIVLFTHGSAIQIIWEMLGEDVDSNKYDEIPLEPAGISALYLSRLGCRIKILEGAKENEDA